MYSGTSQKLQILEKEYRLVLRVDPRLLGLQQGPSTSFASTMIPFSSQIVWFMVIEYISIYTGKIGIEQAFICLHLSIAADRRLRIRGADALYDGPVLSHRQWAFAEPLG